MSQPKEVVLQFVQNVEEIGVARFAGIKIENLILNHYCNFFLVATKFILNSVHVYKIL